MDFLSMFAHIRRLCVNSRTLDIGKTIGPVCRQTLILTLEGEGVRGM
ncbi:MAG: hypothetical protein HFI26_09630 [Lachnospiraceae bacterium]|nr:hypothetical protein [Lachnospiraceae bacterium]